MVKFAWIEDGKVCVRAAFRKNDPDAVAIFKDAAEGRFYTGPVWDYDLAFENDGRTYPINNLSDYMLGNSSHFT